MHPTIAAAPRAGGGLGAEDRAVERAVDRVEVDRPVGGLPREFPGLLVSRVVVGNTAETEFAMSWDPDALDAAVARLVEDGPLWL